MVAVVIGAWCGGGNEARGLEAVMAEAAMVVAATASCTS